MAVARRVGASRRRRVRGGRRGRLKALGDVGRRSSA
jgi:hypothetical protein